MNKKKIGLFLGAAPHFGGTFQYNQSLLQAFTDLPNDEFEPVVGYGHAAWPEHLARLCLPYMQIPYGYWGRPFAQIVRYSHCTLGIWKKLASHLHPTIKALVEARCDLWLFPSHDPWSYLAPVPSLATIHDLMHRYERRFPEVGNYWERCWRDWHFTQTCRTARGIVVDSEIGRKQVVESYGISAERVHLLPYVAGPSFFTDSDDLTTGKAYELPEKFLFYPAQFWEHKNHKRLILAVGKLKERFTDIKLVLVGSRKNGYESTRELVRSLGLEAQILFLGYVPDKDMKTLYRLAHALVMPTCFGPTNIPPLEAMVAGCPMAISGIYGMPEQVQDAAILFDPESVEDMSNALAELWDNDALCRRLINRGKLVAEQWTHGHFAKRVADILRTVVNATEQPFYSNDTVISPEVS